jgi:S-adenosylmethionine-diacylglycerol 3-amino-3-carboxypropyl transferase
VAVTAFDTNAAQLAHMKAKAEATLRRDLGALNVENAASAGLNQCGDFERVFRLLRAFFEEFIASHHELLAFFIRARSLPELDAMVRRWTTSRYWRAAFHACFEEVLVETTLGASLRAGLKTARTRGTSRRRSSEGSGATPPPRTRFCSTSSWAGYRRECAPHYIRHGGRLDVTPVHGTLLEVPELERFDVVSLGNLLDGMEDAEIATWARALKQALAPGSALLIRQMNSTQKLRPFFEPEFRFDDHIGRSYALRDRSLLYNRFEVGFRTAI